MTLDSPVGKLEIRKCDHQLLLPMYFGVTKKDPKYDFLVAGNIETIPGKDYVPSCEEVLKQRKK
jgi:branched-chain amino acid transport system substrate-binding protein